MTAGCPPPLVSGREISAYLVIDLRSLFPALALRMSHGIPRQAAGSGGARRVSYRATQRALFT
jgi:hypothetical protein